MIFILKLSDKSYIIGITNDNNGGMVMKYEKPDLELVALEENDVIAASYTKGEDNGGFGVIL